MYSPSHPGPRGMIKQFCSHHKGTANPLSSRGGGGV